MSENKKDIYFASKIFRDGRYPTKIEARYDEEGKHILLEGRGLEMIELSAMLVKHIAEKAHLDIDEYCKIIKQEIQNMQNDNDDNDDDMITRFNKMFNDLK